ncbi:diacylglycerol kinase family protein [Heyndrickxia camelliae]|uniref:Diacylglycerol kinase n=1 Tax=Heyndrickxia camelliae TaxID=1707093 RepID=A0A2N3LKH2_9BACI|nr:diacylglycerol kinase family protein [Heyndrickxia camelliae]PKR85106.1 diacylglycerol kinase [Heyndrickxia camelliae]
MNMDLKDKQKTPLHKTFSFAICGIIHGFKAEKNFKIHAAAAIMAISISFLLRISLMEWLFVILSIFGVVSLELVNSAIERVVDLAAPGYHPLAKQAKDLAAGAVLVYSIMSVIIACVIFIPKFAHLIINFI